VAERTFYMEKTMPLHILVVFLTFNFC